MDEHYCHVYIHESRDAYGQPWLGARFERYRLFLPDKPLWITEAGFPNRANWPDWGDAALIDWLNVIEGLDVQGVALWILGDKDQWGRPWYDGGNPRPLVYTLGQMQAPEPAQIPTPIEEDEPVSETLSADVAVTAWRWHTEEAVRELQAGKVDAARARLLALANRESGLAYRTEECVHALIETLKTV
jgi:hypothetical protein